MGRRKQNTFRLSSADASSFAASAVVRDSTDVAETLAQVIMHLSAMGSSGFRLDVAISDNVVNELRGLGYKVRNFPAIPYVDIKWTGGS